MSHASNAKLNYRQTRPNDEYYTTYEVVAKELNHYVPLLKGKHVYCPCDDPFHSAFVRFFLDKQQELGLASFTTSCLGQTRLSPLALSCHNGKITALEGSGDYASPECLELLKRCDVVVTNPPFSQWAKFFSLVQEYKKDFILLGPFIHGGSKASQILRLLKQGHMRFGPTSPAGGIPFESQNGSKNINVRWYTSLAPPAPRGLLKLSSTYSEERYPRYDNFPEAIEVSKVKDIPIDYSGLMGVPVTFLDKYTYKREPDLKIELVGLSSELAEPFYRSKGRNFYLKGRRRFERLVIKVTPPQK